MKLGLGIGIGCVAGAAGTPSYEFTSDIVILAYGQSNEQGANMGGGTAPIDPVLDQDASGRIRRWDAAGGTDVAAVQPLSGWPAQYQEAPIRAFRMAQDLLARQDPAKKIILVNCAVGGSKLTGDTLGVGGAYYTVMISRMTACLAAFPGARVFLSWTQGEQDANESVTASAYTTAFNAMLAGIRSVPGASGLQAFIHQMVPERFWGGSADLPYRQVIDTAHKTIPLNTAGCIYIPASFGTQIASDPSHFTAQGHRNAGTRAAAWLNRVTTWQTTVPAVPAAPVQTTDGVISITVSDPQPPAYVIEYRASGSTGAWTEQVVFPNVWIEPGASFEATVGGSGLREVRLKARSYAGTSAASAPITVGTAMADWWTVGAYADLDYENDRAYINGTPYVSIAAARAAGALVQTGGIDRMPLPALAASYAIAAKGVTAATLPVEGTPQYIAALDDGADGTPADHLAALTWSRSNTPAYANMIMFASGVSQLEAIPDARASIAKAASSACRMALRVKLNSTIVSVDGASLSTDTACAVPAVNQLVIGNREDGTRPWSGTIKRICFVNAEINETALNGLLA